MKALKIIGKIFAVIFCIVYFFLLTGLLTISFSLNLLSGDYYSDVLKSVDLKDIKLSDLGEDFETDEFGSDTSLQEVLSAYIEKGGIDKEVANAVIENEKIREVIGNFIGDYINYNAGGEKPKISKSDVKAIFEEEDVKKLIDQSSEKIDINIDEIYDQLNKLADEIIEGGGGNSGNSNNNYESNQVIR